MKPISLIIQLPKQRRRAVELYSRDTPFKSKVEQSKLMYKRKPKHRNKDSE